jgi:acyl-CoA thioester hydrolase
MVLLRVQLRWSDLDGLGHVNQAHYHEYLEEARSVLFSRVGGVNEEYVLARIELDHIAEVRRGARHVDVAAQVIDVGRSSVRIEHEIRAPDGNVVARGVAVMVAWDGRARGKRPLGEQERQRLVEMRADRRSSVSPSMRES